MNESLSTSINKPISGTRKIAPVTIVFPYHNEAPTIHKTIELICSQTVLPREVIFVNSSSPDNCSEVIDQWILENQEQWPIQFKNIFKGTNTPASSKNAGIDEATSEYIGFMDCGLLFPDNWIESHMSKLKEAGEKFISGVCLFLGDSLIDSCAMAQTYGYKRTRPTVPSTIVHRDVIERAGKFLENRRAGYDAIWPTHVERHGFKRIVNEEVVIRYNGINFAPGLWAIMKKSELYAIPTVALPYYYIPYIYLLILVCCLFLLIFNLKAFLFFALLYVAARGFAIPLWKSQNSLIFSDHPMSVIFLTIVAVMMDTGRVRGILKGFLKYHLKFQLN